jgi:hypothetical protein
MTQSTADLAADIANLSIETKALYAFLDERGYVAHGDSVWSKGEVIVDADGLGTTVIFDHGDTMFQNAVHAACWELGIDVPSFD